MTHIPRYIFLATLAVWARTAHAADASAVVDSLAVFDDPVRASMAECYANPALEQYRHAVSLSQIDATFATRNASRTVQAAEGKGATGWGIGARTYMHVGAQTIWGDAGYRRGTTRKVRWCETADADLLYPYISADTIGGDIQSECYRLGGGYGARTGRWGWGASLAYDATLNYRTIDPRPRNVTGMLDMKVGAAYTIAETYDLGASVALKKYNQTSTMLYVSEAGKSILYLLTGPVSDYRRFAGAADDSHFGGWQYGASVTLYPRSGSGFVANAEVSRFSFTKHLTDLNNLPLCRAWHNQMSLMAGYTRSGWNVIGRFEAYRRHGIEGVFGDPTAGAYPLIGELEMYADNHYAASVQSEVMQLLSPAMHLDLGASVGYTHRSTIYADPATEILTNGLRWSVRAGLRGAVGRWYLHPSLLVAGRAPVDTRHNLEVNTALPGLTQTVVNHMNILEKPATRAAAQWSMSRAVGSRYALGLDIAYSCTFMSGGTTESTFAVALKFNF